MERGGGEREYAKGATKLREKKKGLEREDDGNAKEREVFFVYPSESCVVFSRKIFNPHNPFPCTSSVDDKSSVCAFQTAVFAVPTVIGRRERESVCV